MFWVSGKYKCFYYFYVILLMLKKSKNPYCNGIQTPRLSIKPLKNKINAIAVSRDIVKNITLTELDKNEL